MLQCLTNQQHSPLQTPPWYFLKFYVPWTGTFFLEGRTMALKVWLDPGSFARNASRESELHKRFLVPGKCSCSGNRPIEWEVGNTRTGRRLSQGWHRRQSFPLRCNPPNLRVHGMWEDTTQKKCLIISSFYLDSGIPGRRVQSVIKPAHFIDSIIVTHECVLPSAIRDGVEITREEEHLG